MTPTARTLAHLRGQGAIAEVVERWIPHARVRKDLFGFADIFSVSVDGSCSLIQVTSGSNVAARVTKARLALQAAPQLTISGLRLIVHGWAKRKPRGQARPSWTLREVEL